MKKLIILAFLLLFGVTIANAQKTNLDNISEKERTEYLLQVTKEVIMKYAPGWFREVGGYKIERKEYSQKRSIERYGNVAYRIIRYYDTSKEIFDKGFSTIVSVNEKNGKVTNISFGDDGTGWGGLDEPELFDKAPFREFIEGVSSKKK